MKKQYVHPDQETYNYIKDNIYNVIETCYNAIEIRFNWRRNTSGLTGSMKPKYRKAFLQDIPACEKALDDICKMLNNDEDIEVIIMILLNIWSLINNWLCYRSFVTYNLFRPSKGKKYRHIKKTYLRNIAKNPFSSFRGY